MKTFNHMGTRALATCLFVSIAPMTAAAQNASSQNTQGPMVVERIKSGFVGAPDLKVTEVDRTVSELAGAYAGWLYDKTLLIGGGGYWLVNQSRDREMAYGGLVVGWLARTDRRVGFGVKGLIGGGEATLSRTITSILNVPSSRDGPFGPSPTIPGRVGPQLVTTRVRFRDGFFIAEPEANLLVGLSKRFRLSSGVGYRLIGGARGTGDRLRGVTGSIALQIG